MARLTEQEKQALLASIRRPSSGAPAERPPRSPALSPSDYVAFATFASKFDRSRKPVRFVGDKWRL